MGDLWQSLPVLAQDVIVTLALLLPGLLVGLALRREYAPDALVGAMLRRFRGANAVFIVLMAASVAIGVGLTAQEKAVRRGTAEAAAKFDLVIGAPGSEITLMLAAVYLQAADMPLLTGAQYAEIAADPDVAFAAPLAFGDSHDGHPVVGSTAAFVAHLSGELTEGQVFETAAQAVVGADVPLQPGQTFTPAHGHGPVADDGAHTGAEYTVTGRMAPTDSPWDRAIVVPVEGVWEVHGLANGHASEAGDQIGPPFDAAYFPGTPAILVRADAVWANYALKSRYTTADMMGIFPGSVLSQLHGLLADVRAAMSVLAVATQAMVAIGVLAGLVLLMRIFARSLALLRAIGAPVRFVLAVVWSYAAALIGMGAAVGLALGWVAAVVLSAVLSARTEMRIAATIGWTEVQMVAAFLSLALILAVIPAWLAARRPIISDLRT